MASIVYLKHCKFTVNRVFLPELKKKTGFSLADHGTDIEITAHLVSPPTRLRPQDDQTKEWWGRWLAVIKIAIFLTHNNI